MPRRSADSIAVEIGKLIRVQRGLCGMTQESLAGLIGVTFQQVQKYERGDNHCSPSRLYQIARVLGCRVQDLLPPEAGDPPAERGALLAFQAVVDGLRPHIEVLSRMAPEEQARALRVLRALAS